MSKFWFGQSILLMLTCSSSISPAFCSYDKVYMGHATKENYGSCSAVFKKSSGGEISGIVQPYERELNCTAKIEAPRGTMIDVDIKSINFVTTQPGGCYSVKLLIYDGDTFENSNIIPLYPNGICNQSIPSHRIRTRSNRLSVRFEVINTAYEVSFNVIYTSFKTFDDGYCNFCNDNPICIPTELKCDGLANCEDSSDEDNCETEDNNDESKGVTMWVIICVVIGIVILITVFIGSLLVYRCRKVIKNSETSNIPGLQQPVNCTSNRPQSPPIVTSNELSPGYSQAHGSSVAGSLPTDQPPSYERSLQDAAAEERALKRTLAQDR